MGNVGKVARLLVTPVQKKKKEVFSNSKALELN